MKCYISKNKNLKLRNRIILRGYTAIELIVSLVIMMIMLGIVYSDYPRMNEIIYFNAKAHEVSAIVKSAQTYGASGGGDSKGAGVYVSLNTKNDIIEFSDITIPGLLSIDGLPMSNSYYDTDNDKITKHNYLPNQVQISRICIKTDSGVIDCTKNRLSITFNRPKLTATITDFSLKSGFGDEVNNFVAGYIELYHTRLKDGTNKKCIEVISVGQVNIKNSKCDTI